MRQRAVSVKVYLISSLHDLKQFALAACQKRSYFPSFQNQYVAIVHGLASVDLSPKMGHISKMLFYPSIRVDGVEIALSAIRENGYTGHAGSNSVSHTLYSHNYRSR